MEGPTIDITGKKINSIFRRSELKYIIICSIILSLIIILITNFLMIYIENQYLESSYLYPIAYINSVKSNIIFNFPTANIVFLLTTIMFSYYLFAEANIHFKYRKYYLTPDDNFINIFNLPLAINFSIITIVFYSFSFINLIKEINQDFSPMEIWIPIFFLMFLMPGFLLFYYYYKGIKYILFNMLSLWNNISSTLKSDLNDEIYNAKSNNTNLWLIVLKISNIKDISTSIKKSSKFILNFVVKNFRRKVRAADYVIALNYDKAIIGYIINNEQKTIQALISNKVKPFLSSNILYKGIQLDLVVTHELINIEKNDEINNIKDIYNYSKSM